MSVIPTMIRRTGILLAASLVILTLLAVIPAGTPTAHAATDHLITDVGGVQVTGATSVNGERINGILSDGTHVTDGKTLNLQGDDVSLTLKGWITDVASIPAGDSVIIPWQSDPASHYPTPALGGPLQLTDKTGRPLFTVTYVGVTTIRLTRTGQAAVGRYDFTLTTALSETHRDYSSEQRLKSTTSTWTIGGAKVVLDNKPYENPVCTWPLIVGSDQIDLQNQNSIYEFFQTQCEPVNRLLAGNDPKTSQDPFIVYARITPGRGGISDITRHSLLARLNLASDPTHVGQMQDYAVDYKPNPGAATHADIHDWDAAAANLTRPGQYSIEKNQDGTWDVAANIGAQQGDQAILLDPDTANAHGWWSTDTLSQARTLRARKMSGTETSFRVDIHYTHPDQASTAEAEYTIGQPGGRIWKHATTDLYNSIGAQQGADQARITYQPNGDTTGTPTGKVADTPGTPGTGVKAAQNGYTWTGHTFTGWNTEPDGTGTPVRPGQTVTLPGERQTLVLYAQWAADSTQTLPATGGDRPARPGVLLPVLLALAGLSGGAWAFRRRRRRTPPEHQ